MGFHPIVFFFGGYKFPLEIHDSYPAKNDFEEVATYNFVCYH